MSFEMTGRHMFKTRREKTASLLELFRTVLYIVLITTVAVTSVSPGWVAPCGSGCCGCCRSQFESWRGRDPRNMAWNTRNNLDWRRDNKSLRLNMTIDCYWLIRWVSSGSMGRCTVTCQWWHLQLHHHKSSFCGFDTTIFKTLHCIVKPLKGLRNITHKDMDILDFLWILTLLS